MAELAAPTPLTAATVATSASTWSAAAILTLVLVTSIFNICVGKNSCKYSRVANKEYAGLQYILQMILLVSI